MRPTGEIFIHLLIYKIEVGLKLDFEKVHNLYMSLIGLKKCIWDS